MRVAPLLFSLAALAGCGGGVGSVGAVFGRDNETHAVYVREVPPGLGASDAGMLAGDQILMIDGLHVRDLDPKEIRAHLRGEVGTPVTLTIVRGGRVHRIRVTRTALRAHAAPAPREERIAP